MLIHLPTVHAVIDSVRPLFEATPTPTPAPAPTSLNTEGILGFFASRIAPIGLAFLGLVFVGRARRGEVSQVMTSSTIALIGVAFIAGATALVFVGDTLVKLVIQ
jgi:hypothetical protein